MENVVYYLFFFMIIPMIYALAFFDNKSRLLFGSLITGIVVCLLAAEINGIFLGLCGSDFFYLSTMISPIVEELLKGLPVVFVAFCLLDNCRLDTMISCGFSVGIGFSILENIVTYFQHYQSASFYWILSRSFGAGLVHGICTAVVAIGLCFVKRNQKQGIFLLMGLFSAVIIYHGIYNCLVQTSNLVWLGILFPTVTYIILFLARKNIVLIKEILKNQESI